MYLRINRLFGEIESIELINSIIRMSPTSLIVITSNGEYTIKDDDANCNNMFYNFASSSVWTIFESDDEEETYYLG